MLSSIYFRDPIAENFTEINIFRIDAIEVTAEVTLILECCNPQPHRGPRNLVHIVGYSAILLLALGSLKIKFTKYFLWLSFTFGLPFGLQFEPKKVQSTGNRRQIQVKLKLFILIPFLLYFVVCELNERY